MAESVLQIQGLCKNFGGLRATDDLSLDVRAGEVHALIGPNGAGKTTLIHQMAGTLAPDAGTLRLHGEDVTALPVSERVRRGIARSYQITNVFRTLTVLENVALAVQARQKRIFSFWQPVAKDRALHDEAAAVLERLGLSSLAHQPAQRISYGDQRLLEVGLALATRPKVLLLDEPMAGMGEAESERMVHLIEQLRQELSIILVEHDMNAVFRVADRISVLVYGRVIATGEPAAIRENPEVVAAYLGEEESV